MPIPASPDPSNSIVAGSGMVEELTVIVPGPEALVFHVPKSLLSNPLTTKKYEVPAFRLKVNEESPIIGLSSFPTRSFVKGEAGLKLF
jgi:hypothetical protein